MKKLLFALLFAALSLPAYAGPGQFSGTVTIPIGSTLTFTGASTGCALVNSSGIVFQGSCPVGTAAFSGTNPIVVTGAGPYTITCPNCFSKATGGSIAAAVIFNNTTTFNQLATFTAGITSSSSTVPLFLGVSGAYTTGGYQMGTTGGGIKLSTTSVAGCQSVVGNALHIGTVGGSFIADIDTSGNAGFCGTVQMASKRDYKTLIRPAQIDGLATLDPIDFNLAWHYKWPYGNPGPRHVGPMADDLPTFISGAKHDHVDQYALLVASDIAIQQLHRQVEILYSMFGFFALVLALICVLAISHFGKR